MRPTTTNFSFFVLPNRKYYISNSSINSRYMSAKAFNSSGKILLTADLHENIFNFLTFSHIFYIFTPKFFVLILHPVFYMLSIKYPHYVFCWKDFPPTYPLTFYTVSCKSLNQITLILYKSILRNILFDSKTYLRLLFSFQPN